MSSVAMTTAEYAAHRGVSDSYIRRMRRKGNLVLTADDRIDARASDELLNGVTNPIHGGKRVVVERPAGNAAAFAQTPKTVITVQEAVRRERLARARLAELELGEEAKQLTRVEEANRAVFTLVRQALNQLQGMSGRLRKTLAAETDAFKVGEIIDADVANICKEMRESATKLLKAPAPDADSAKVEDAEDGDGFEEEAAAE